MRKSNGSQAVLAKPRRNVSISEKTFDIGAGKSSFALTFSRKAGVYCLQISFKKTCISVRKKKEEAWLSWLPLIEFADVAQW